MKFKAKVNLKGREEATIILNAFFEEFNPESSIFIKGGILETNVVFQEPPLKIVKAIADCEDIEFSYGVISKEGDTKQVTKQSEISSKGEGVEKENAEIKRLLKKGFNPELISFEFDVSLEQVKQCQNEIENSYNKLEKMREKYNSLFLKKDKIPQKTIRELTEQENEIAEQVIREVEEEIIHLGKVNNIRNKREIIKEILKKVKKIEEYPLTLEQTQKICDSIYFEEIDKLDVSDFRHVIRKSRLKFTQHLVKLICIKIEEIDDIEQLKLLGKNIKPEMKQVDFLSVDMANNLIWNKITNLKNKKVFDKIRNDIPANIESIIIDLANGNLNIEKANEIILEEARKRVESNPKEKFFKTEERERNQLLIQIRMAIREQGEKYPVQNPKVTLQKMKELYGDEVEQSVIAIVNNFSDRKEYTAAKMICKLIPSEQGRKRLKKSIIHSEVRDFILKGIQMRGTEEEECEYFGMLERGLKLGNIKLEEVYLDDRQDGSGKITLADIWPDRQEKEIIR